MRPPSGLMYAASGGDIVARGLDQDGNTSARAIPLDEARTLRLFHIGEATRQATLEGRDFCERCAFELFEAISRAVQWKAAA